MLWFEHLVSFWRILYQFSLFFALPHVGNLCCSAKFSSIFVSADGIEVSNAVCGSIAFSLCRLVLIDFFMLVLIDFFMLLETLYW